MNLAQKNRPRIKRGQEPMGGFVSTDTTKDILLTSIHNYYTTKEIIMSIFKLQRRYLCQVYKNLKTFLEKKC